MKNMILKGDVCYQTSPKSFVTVKSGYLVITGGIVAGVYEKMPDGFSGYDFYDYEGKLIVPGLIDLHLHASQNAFRGTAMDLELIDWLNEKAFREESKFSQIDYAKKSYGIFTDELIRSATTRAVIFATMHNDATVELMNALDGSGLKAYVGKVNMDRNSPPYLCETDAKTSLRDTVDVISRTENLKNVKPILTPRFTPSCTDELFKGLEELQIEYDLPVQSHLSENLGEIELVKNLRPEAEFYGKTYDAYGLFGKSKSGKSVKTVMAHCVWSGDDEQALMKENGVFIAHSPLSNLNLSSGIAPIRRYLNKGLKVGLATDVAGGNTKSMFSAIVACVQVSKMHWRLVDSSEKPITFAEAFYLSTKGGGEFFGKVGSFESGYEADILVLDDGILPSPCDFSIEKRLERYAYLNGDLRQGGIMAKFVDGEKIF